MENKMNLIKATSLETTPNVVETLDWKITSLIEQDKNVSNGLADYIGMAVGNLDGQLAQLKEVEAEIKERKAAVTSQMKRIKQEGAAFLEGQGVDRLEGVITSSVTIRKGKPAGTKKVFKTELTKKQIEEMIENACLGYYEEVETPETKDALVINKRKIAHATVEEE